MRQSPDGGPDLAAVASLLADGTRATFCLALLDGRAWTATELARYAGVAASTATEHLNLLVSGGLLAQQRQGRHRYVQIADSRVAELVEDLAALATEPVSRPRSLSADTRSRALGRARVCYDHLAGALGVAITDSLTSQNYLGWQGGISLTAAGKDWADELGLVISPKSRRPLVRSCLDWTERRPHLAGSLGAALCQRSLEAGWVVRGTSRALKITPAGARIFADQLGVNSEVLTAHQPR